MTTILTTHRPAHAVGALRRLNSLLDATVAEAAGVAATVGGWQPAVDVTEDAGALRLRAELPGVAPEGVTITLEDNVLTIRGEKKQEGEEPGERWHRFERRFGAFARTFRVPATVDAERIEAHYGHGVLTVVLPKVEKAQPRTIRVAVRA